MGAVIAMRDAARGDRTRHAARRGRRARGRTELHQPLVEVAGSRGLGECTYQLAGARPQRLVPGGALDVVFDREHACEHAGDVAVDQRRAFAVRDRRDRAGGIRPDAAHRPQSGRGRGQRTTVARGDLACARPQVARTRVVAESRPGGQHVVERRGGERRHRRELRHPAFPVRDHRGNPRLLQHHLADPDRVRVARAPPRQIAPCALEVRDHRGRELRQAAVRNRLRERAPSGSADRGSEVG